MAGISMTASRYTSNLYDHVISKGLELSARHGNRVMLVQTKNQFFFFPEIAWQLLLIQVKEK